jgi:hypothetical protein
MKKMKTSKLFALLRHTYPDKEWQREPYIVEGEDRHAILFTCKGIAIHNPFESECSRFEMANHYGLSEHHAKLMRCHNLGFEVQVSDGVHPLSFVFDCVIDEIRGHPAAGPEPLLDAFGFTAVNMGRGELENILANPDDSYLSIMDRNGDTLPRTMQDAWIRLYDSAGLVVKSYCARD